MAVKTNEMVKKAEKEYQYLIGDAAERRKEELRRKKILDDNTRMHGAREEGIVLGIERGIEQERKYTAKKMLLLKFDIKIISKITGLSENEIKKIRH